MTRTQRIEPVLRRVDDDERERSRVLAQARLKQTDAESKRDELARYRADYLRGFDQQARDGASSLRLRDYRLFLARLDDALKQQDGVVARARADVERETRAWQDAARKARALGHVIDKWRGDERRAAERQEQRETDERATNAAARRARS